ncbi:hypothetical protein [Leucobacter chinensis]|uniref:hypothetical protein n=1 Tax=Leucobacter chinensis TaxID=2851010 RepID=UPI001C22D4B8|nr:hypothetical protein [Leucobacter chinensis]
MSEASVIAIIGIGATLIGTIAGALISALVIGHHAKQDRLDTRRQAQLRSLTNTIAALREWSSIRHTNALYMAALDSFEELDAYMRDSVDSWTATELLRLNRESERSLAESRVIVKDKELVDALECVVKLRKHSTVELHKFTEENLRERGDKVKRAVAVIRAQEAFEEGLKRLETAARNSLAVSVNPSR